MRLHPRTRLLLGLLLGAWLLALDSTGAAQSATRPPATHHVDPGAADRHGRAAHFISPLPTPLPTPLAPPPIGGAAPLVASPGLTIHGLALGPSNAYLIETAAGVTLVDAGMGFSTPTVRKKLREIGRADDLCLIYLTHAHIDHIGAANALRTASGAAVLVHADDADALAAGETTLGSVRDWEWTRRPLPVIERALRIEPILADLLVADGDSLRSCGLDATVLHTPGHTDGSSTLLVRDPATDLVYAFAGDLISTSGGVHVQSSYAHDWSQIGPSLERLRAADPELVFPGHGRTVVTRAQLAAMELTGPAAAYK